MVTENRGDSLLTIYTFSRYYWRCNSSKGENLMKLSENHHLQKNQILIKKICIPLHFLNFQMLIYLYRKYETI